MYALIGTCALNDIDPRAYLDYVLAQIADHKINHIDDASAATRGQQAAHASQSADTRYLTAQVRITIVPHVRARGRTARVSRLPADTVSVRSAVGSDFRLTPDS